MYISSSIVVIGAGSYGTALAISLARNGHKVLLWGRNYKKIKLLETSRCNQTYLPDIQFPSILRLESSLSIALASSRNILVVVPSHVFGKVLIQLKPHLKQDARIVWATKGLESETGRLLEDVARDILGPKIPLAVISGPAFASELASGLPISIILASKYIAFRNYLKKIFYFRGRFHVYVTSDIIGVQLAGAVKNVIAISAGISDGVDLGANSRMLLITQGLSEMSRLGKSMGASQSTFNGMAGLGDLVLTCTDNKSRNRYFGILIGKRVSIQDAKKRIGQVVEGYQNTKEVLVLANRYGVSMPIVEQLYRVLYNEKNTYTAVSVFLEQIVK